VGCHIFYTKKASATVLPAATVQGDHGFLIGACRIVFVYPHFKRTVTAGR